MTKNQMENTANNHERQLFLANSGKNEHLRITKNVCLIGLAFMLHFTAFHGTANLQSSINASMGTYSLAAIYASLILSNIFLPVIVIRWFGCKWTIAISFMAYMPFIIAQFFPRLYTLIPAGLAVGFGGGPLWCAKCTYLTIISEALSILRGKSGNTDAQVVRFFGLFFVFYQMAQVWGNLISSSVLSHGQNPVGTNATVMPLHNVEELCGAKFCAYNMAAEGNPNLTLPDMSKIHLLGAIFLCLMICACLVVAFGVDSLKRYDLGRKGSGSGLSGIRLLSVTVRQLLQWKQILLLPITMFIGAEQAFIAVDFTASFIACGGGISRIGYVMICFGIANAVAAFLASTLSKLCGRNVILTVTFVLYAGLLMWMRQYVAVANDFTTYCTMAALFGLADGLFLILINSYYGILFPGKEEAAFSNFRLFEASGSVIAYALSPRLCTDTKLLALFILMCIGMIGYGIVQYIVSLELKAIKNSAVSYQEATNRRSDDENL